MVKNPQIGRPPKPVAAKLNRQIRVALTQAELEQIAKVATGEGRSISNWARQVLLLAAGLR